MSDIFVWNFEGFVNAPSDSLVGELRLFHQEQEWTKATKDSGELPENWGVVPNPTGLFPLSMEELVKGLVDEALEMEMDLAHEVGDTMLPPFDEDDE